MKRLNSFNSRKELKVNGKVYDIFHLDLLKDGGYEIERLPFSIKILLENLLRQEDGNTVRKEDIEALASWAPHKKEEKEISFMPARVLMQDFTGVPAIVDLAAMRDAIKKLGGEPGRINPLQPVDLVIDHSVQIDYFGSKEAFSLNSKKDFERNYERYTFLKWGQQSFKNFRVVPPGTGICHQVNLEHLGRVVFTHEEDGKSLAYFDTLVGTDSHTPMINGLGVVGWGVGGIEAEAAMLGQPISMLIPDVIGFRLYGSLPAGATATDLVLTVTQILRKKGVVGKFVEFYGNGLSGLTVADRATVSNMSPEYGATIGWFPVDHQTLKYLELTGREELIDLVESYTKKQGIFRTDETPAPLFTDTIELDLATVQPSISGPRRPQDRMNIWEIKKTFHKYLTEEMKDEVKKLDPETVQRWIDNGGTSEKPERKGELGSLTRKVKVKDRGTEFELTNGSVVIASVTSCTNTSNPSVMLGSGLLAKKAREKGLEVKPWVKTSFAPGSMVVKSYMNESGLTKYLEELGFHIVAFGCATCIGNSGPLSEPISKAITDNNLTVASVLSGNRNFEGRIHPLTKANYLASPLLVVAYALAGYVDINFETDPLGYDKKNNPVYLRDIWPSGEEIQEAISSFVKMEMFHKDYAEVFEGDEIWKNVEISSGEIYEWNPQSTYIKHPPFFEGMRQKPEPMKDIHNAKVLALLGDSVTTDHISPAGTIPKDSPAGTYLLSLGVEQKDFNSFGSRRGNHEVMMRGTFGNIRLKNLMIPGKEGNWTCHLPDKKLTSIYEAAMDYMKENVPVIVIAGKEYGSGSSRDWAAKGPRLQGVRATIAESYERIHRSNLIGMGVLPLEFTGGENAKSLGLTGFETYDIRGIEEGLKPGTELTVKAFFEDGSEKEFKVKVRIDTPQELEYYRHGGILHYVLRQLV